jgi:hypothetical protein
MTTNPNLLLVEDWNVAAGCALDDLGNPTQMLSIKLQFASPGPAQTATLVFQGELGGPGVGHLLGSDLNVQPDPSTFSTYWNVLTTGRVIGAYVALDDQGNLLSFFLTFAASIGT